jgi:hypothetical protein
MLESIQENKIRPVMEQLLPVMCMSEFGAIPDDINFSFNPVRIPTEKEKAEIATAKTSSIVQAHSEGIISDHIAMEELRSMSDGTGMFSNITDEDIENADKEPDIGDVPEGESEMPEEGSPDTNELSSKNSNVSPGYGKMSDTEYLKRYGKMRGAADTKSEELTESKPTIDEIKEAAKEFTPHYKIVAVRTQEVPFELGKIKHKSERWSDGEPTGEKLNGISATSVGSTAIRKHTSDFDPREGQYQGNYCALIGGNKFKYGHDKGEVVIRDPEVLEILRPKGGENIE